MENEPHTLTYAFMNRYNFKIPYTILFTDWCTEGFPSQVAICHLDFTVQTIHVTDFMTVDGTQEFSDVLDAFTI